MLSPLRQSRKIKVGKVEIGGDAPVSIQSMTNTPTQNVDKTLAQIESLAKLGCDIIRVSVDNACDCAGLKEITAASPIPVIADIQFDASTAVGAIKAGAAGVRLNPGLVRDPVQLTPVAHAALEYNIPVRVGVNSGSVGTDAVKKNIASGMSHDDAMIAALVEAALRQCDQLEKLGVSAIKVALKSSSVPITVAAYKEFAARTDYPLHIGITEAGTYSRGIVKSAAGIGALLLSGLGNTLRVSLTAPPEEEIIAGLMILESCGLRNAEPEIVSCPTCGRTEIDLAGLTGEVEKLITQIKSSGKKIMFRKIAVMGCPVNGPGEAKDADLGIAGSRSGEQLLIFKAGKILGAFPSSEGFAVFEQELRKNCR
jgi:(E)-4-hydroxy-3-methylbut-2-enyl-diphosphate synthase